MNVNKSKERLFANLVLFLGLGILGACGVRAGSGPTALSDSNNDMAATDIGAGHNHGYFIFNGQIVSQVIDGAAAIQNTDDAELSKNLEESASPAETQKLNALIPEKEGEVVVFFDDLPLSKSAVAPVPQARVSASTPLYGISH